MTHTGMKPRLGRPRAIETPEALAEGTYAYFESVKPHAEVRIYESQLKNGKVVVRRGRIVTEAVPPTMGGLAMALNIDRRTLSRYAQDPELSPTIKRARAICEAYLEAELFNPQRKHFGGIILMLKMNYGWTDKPTKQPV